MSGSIARLRVERDYRGLTFQPELVKQGFRGNAQQVGNAAKVIRQGRVVPAVGRVAGQIDSQLYVSDPGMVGFLMVEQHVELLNKF